MSAESMFIDTDFVAARAASKAWLASIRPAAPADAGWAGDDGFADLYETGGARTLLASSDLIDQAISEEWLDQAVVQEGQPLVGFSGSALPFRANAGGHHPLRQSLHDINEYMTPGESMWNEKAMKHRNRSLRRVTTTFRAAMLSFLALQMMSEAAHSFEKNDDDQAGTPGVSQEMPGSVQVPLMTHDSLFEVAEMAITLDELIPIEVGEADVPDGDFVVFNGGGGLTGADGNALHLGDLLNVEETLARIGEDDGQGDTAKTADGKDDDFFSVSAEPAPLFDSLFPDNPLDDQGFG
jgi:hypothetical protein